MTVDVALNNAARVLQKAEQSDDATITDALNRVAGSWLRLGEILFYTASSTGTHQAAP